MKRRILFVVISFLVLLCVSFLSALPAHAMIYVSNIGGNSVAMWPDYTTGDIAPTTNIVGASTTFNGPDAIAVDASRIYVANYGNNSVTVFPIDADGNAAPIRSIQGPATTLSGPSGVAVDASRIYVANYGNNSVTVFPINADGNVAPTRTIKGTSTTLSVSFGVAVDASWIYVANYGNNSVAVFPINAVGNAPPTRFIQGPATTLNGPSGVAVYANLIYVANFNNNSVTVFPINADGNVVPTRSIQGASTTLSGPSGIAVAMRWIYVANYGNDSVDVFQINAVGNAAPIRSIQGASTILNRPRGIAVIITIDPWIQQAKLLAGDGTERDWFGNSVALSNDTALIGAPMDKDLGVGSGSAYVFVRNPVTGAWIQQAKLLVSDGVAYAFGYSVALSNDTALIGAPSDNELSTTRSGSAYVFVRDPATGAWTQQSKLLAVDSAEGDHFGRSVALSNDTALIGAYRDDDLGRNSGSAYVFVRDPSTGAWTYQSKLLAVDGAEGDWFGSSVALSNDTALIGALGDDAMGFNSGSAYVFVRDPVTGYWTRQAKLLAVDGAVNDQFGYSVALSNDTALIGAHTLYDTGIVSGSAYVFVRDPQNSAWSQTKLLAGDGAELDWFSHSVALSNDTALMGARHIDDIGRASGSASAYVFQFQPFADVPPSHWAYDFIVAIYDSGITAGCGGGNYCLDDIVTRAQIAAFIIRAVEGEPAADYCGTTDLFPDVPYGDWACKYIKRLVELGISTGYGDSTYRPTNTVTRAETAAFIIRAVEGEPAADYCGTTDPFPDVPYGDWACKYIKRLVELGITTGCGGANFCPGDNTTRAQMAVFLARAFLGM